MNRKIKTIVVDEETHKEIMKLVHNDGCRNANDVIKKLLETNKCQLNMNKVEKIEGELNQMQGGK